MSKWYPKNGRVIFHLDMNSFYASVEAAYNPKLKGKPLAIAGNPEERRGIIVTSSYEARAKGVKTTMPLWQAKRLCPELIVLPPNFERYRRASKEIFTIMSEITPLVQPVSIDEGYMDISDCHELGPPLEIANALQKRIKKELDLPCSIGIAPNKFLAKMASDMKKPMGITVLRKRDMPTKLWPLDIEEMYGVGEKTAEKLRKMDIYIIGDLIEADRYHLKRVLGINGERIQQRAKGFDNRPVDPDAVYDFKSIGNSKTLREDTTDELTITALLRNLSNKVAKRLANKEVVAQTLQITIRYDTHNTITRSITTADYLFEEEEIFKIAVDLFETNWTGEPIRLLGVTAQNLIEKKEAVQQLNLFNFKDHLKDEKLQKTIEQLSTKFGKNPFKKIKNQIEKDQPTTSFQKDFLDDYKNK